MWRWTKRILQAAIGEDGTRTVWPGLTPASREVMRLASVEANDLGHPCLADEHLLLGLLRHGDNEPASLLRAMGLDLATARADLMRIGPTLGPQVNPARALEAVGIDVEQVRRCLESVFGVQVLSAAERRVRRRSRWRGGHPRPDALCSYLLAKRALELASDCATGRGEAGIAPQDLLYGVLQDARDPLGTQLSRRSRQDLDTLGFKRGSPNPVRLQLEAHGLDLNRLAFDLRASF